jgi:predicted nucleotidyltransferase
MKSSLSLDPKPRSVIVGDVNNDHQLDIIVANYLSDSVLDMVMEHFKIKPSFQQVIILARIA